MLQRGLNKIFCQKGVKMKEKAYHHKSQWNHTVISQNTMQSEILEILCLM